MFDIVFFVFVVFLLSFDPSVLLIVLLMFGNILTCKNRKDFYTFLLPMKFAISVFY